ncbi:MAG: tRNA (guanosine(37)-N1)-methyltransferase TrmD [Mogibacterium sp.]|nr:tRNA (guanosine(37)-N1)-methyltransferase TrmD [Mogibacterium sp.]
MKINILTIFPEMFAPLRMSMLGRAIDNGIIELNITNIRDYTTDRHNRVDDTPYGGGAGMVMQVQPILAAFEASGSGGDVIYMSPRGEMLSGEMARELSGKEEITILCGHYEGVDQRALDRLNAREVSIGDYVLTGGELPAMVLIDTVARFIDGVLAGDDSVCDESIYSGLLEYPQYSKPREYDGDMVPEILLSGNHGEIDLWRWEQALSLTKERRPDLFEAYVKSEHELTKKQKAILAKYF